MMRVCIDPGHGGADPGAIGNGLRESNLNLSIALHLKALLILNGIDVVMTRDADIAVSLSNRVAIADKSKAGLFVSIHINAGGGTGTEVLIIGRGGRAEIAANKVLPHLVKTGAWVNRGVKTQNVYVIRETAMPAILTESGFIDNMTDAVKLNNDYFRQGLAVAHAKGICDYFGIKYKGAAIAPVAPVADPDVYLSVRVRTSKAVALAEQIVEMGYACKPLDLA